MNFIWLAFAINIASAAPICSDFFRESCADGVETPDPIGGSTTAKKEFRDNLKTKVTDDCERGWIEYEILGEANTSCDASQVRKTGKIITSRGYKTALKAARADYRKRLRSDQVLSDLRGIHERMRTLVTAKLPKEMAEAVGKIQISEKDCSELGGIDHDDTVIFSNQFKREGEIFVCSGFLEKNASETTLAYAIAHELMHAADICAYHVTVKPYARDVEIEDQYPLGNVVKCLRQDGAAGAKKASNYAGVIGAGRFDVQNCIDRDQASEALADWMAAEVMPEYMAGRKPPIEGASRVNAYKNILRGTCGENLDGENALKYLSGSVRANRLLMANPSVRKDVGCAGEASKAEYCSINTKSGGGLSEGEISK